MYRPIIPNEHQNPMTEFNDKLREAIKRGQRESDAKLQNQQIKQLSEDEVRRQHNDFRLRLSDRIEKGLHSFIDQMPGFEYETVYGDRGWGGAVSRDELRITGGQRTNVYSRLELTVKPLSELRIVNIVAKGTVKNKENFSRNFPSKK